MNLQEIRKVRKLLRSFENLDGLVLAGKITGLKRTCEYVRKLSKSDLYNIIHGIPKNFRKKCLNCGKIIKVTSLGKGYRDFCSSGCALKYYPKTLGVKNISQLTEIKEKISKKVSGKQHGEKIKESVKKKYGVENVFQLEKVKEKMRETFKNKYGTDHPMKNEDYCRSVIKHREENVENFFHYTQKNYKNFSDFNKSFIEENFKTKFGYDILAIKNYFNITGNLIKLLSKININLEKNKYRSSLEKIVDDFIKECGFKTIINDRKIIKPLEIDILVENKLAIEIQGDFYHANPKIFNEDDMIFKGKKAKDIWKKDKIKKDLILKNGYMFLEIWENEIISGEYKNILNNVLKEIK